MTYTNYKHVEWLSLMEVSGPFLALEVLKKVFPQGLDSLATSKRQKLRIAYDEWLDAIDENDADLDELHKAWISLVFSDMLEFEDTDFLLPVNGSFRYTPIEHDGDFSADFAIKSDDQNPAILVSIQPIGVDLEKIKSGDGWPVNIAERMVLLCRDKGVRFGLITNGERWMLVNAPIGSTSSFISWYSRLWFQEPVTLNAFYSLLGIRRIYSPKEEQLSALFDASLEHHEEVTNTLGEQVRQAVEVLIQALDKADQDRNRELLQDIGAKELYEAGLTVMMRLVFILSAEERALLLLGDPLYDQHYAISTLRAKLTEDSDRYGPEVLERRYDAWSRLLAMFRAVYGGIEHESLRMPGLGGSLFDPDRFSFLEGRAKGTSWEQENAKPLPIDNRTVLLLLKSLQILEQSGGALQLSYKALDVEQIGHVYEGLLEYTVKRIPEVTLGFEGSKKAKNPNVSLRILEEALQKNSEELFKVLEEATLRSKSAIKNAFENEIDDNYFSQLIASCGGDVDLAKRIRPFANYFRKDAWGDLVIYKANAFAVSLGSDRSKAGAHYTPKSLTESVVKTTLEPIVYIGPSDGKPKEEWVLVSAEKIMDLKVCDPAMGSGAFLVQVCRYLSERLVEAWAIEEANDKFISVDGDTKDFLLDLESMPTSLDDRLMIARRIIAERCLYGVDLNPLAVELAKLSIWLVTLAKGRPFGFLDHNLRSGDSLLGIDNMEQLTKFSIKPESKSKPTLFSQEIERSVNEVISLRKELRMLPIRDIEDVQAMARIDHEVRSKLSMIKTVADAMIGEVLRTDSKTKELQSALDSLSTDVGDALVGDKVAIYNIEEIAKNSLTFDLPIGSEIRKPFHWALEFPEVLVERGGFDAIVGNPPFLGGQKLTGFLGTIYRDYLVHYIANGKRGSADLVAYFFLHSHKLLKRNGTLGLIATNTIAEGDTREVGLSQILDRIATVFRAYPSEPWPGNASVVTSRVHIVKNNVWHGKLILSDKEVAKIDAFLSDEDSRVPQKLKKNENSSFQGSIILGLGFTITEEEAKAQIKQNSKNADVLYPYLNGRDLNSTPSHHPSRWVINFWDWSFDRCEKEHPELLKILEEKVKPERQRQKEDGKFVLRKPLPQKWWIYGEKRPALYHAIGRGNLFEKHSASVWPKKPLDEVLAITRVSKFLNCVAVKNVSIYTLDLIIISLQEKAYFSILQSTIHEVWTRKQSSSHETRLRYTPSDCFETMPFPEMMSLHPEEVDWNNESVQNLEAIGKQYHNKRQEILLSRQVGLTNLYNLFHNPTITDNDIFELRKMHSRMDEAVKTAYGWDDLVLDHDFIDVPYLPENDRTRFTISETARLEILKRLLDLNEERYQEEVEAGLWDNKKPKTKKTAKKETISGQGNLF